MSACDKYGYPLAMDDCQAWLDCQAPYRSNALYGHRKGPHEIAFNALRETVKLPPGDKRLPQGGYAGKPSETVTVGMREREAKRILDKHAGKESALAPVSGYQSPDGIEAD